MTIVGIPQDFRIPRPHWLLLRLYRKDLRSVWSWHVNMNWDYNSTRNGLVRIPELILLRRCLSVHNSRTWIGQYRRRSAFFLRMSMLGYVPGVRDRCRLVWRPRNWRVSGPMK